jgi:RND family efflux transporter MFP subunit
MTDERPSLDALRIDRAGGADERPPRRWPWLAAAAAVVLAVAGAWWALAAGGATEVTTAPVVEVRGGSPAVLDASGYVTARRQATVSSKVTGKIVEVLVEEGMVVAEGQVLARLDDSSQRAAVRLAEAGLGAARGALAETEARLAKARLDRARAERLVAEAVAPQDQLDAAATEVDALAARLALERDRVEVAGREAALQRIGLDDTVIRAPFAGVAISKNAQPGEMISPISAGGGFTRTGVCTLVDMESLEIEVDVGESYIQRVHPDQRVEAVLDAYPDWRIPARVITTIPAADREKATVKVRIAFDRLDPRILPDMGVKVSFLDPRAAAAPADEPRSRLLVPRAAVREAAGETRVWVVAEARVEDRAVELGARAGDRVQVLSGLAAGERVVVESSEELSEGQEVEDAGSGS